jgi:hypothetical protein
MSIKTLLITSIAISTCLISCKKQYACQCATTYSSPGYSPYTVSSVKNINEKTTKKRAKEICDHSEKQLNENSLDYKNGSETLTTSCALK